MPCSRPSALAPVCNRIIEKNPMSVLDIGIGFGKFGFLVREYTDIRLGRYFNWKTRIDGIEIFEKYVTRLQREIYDNIYIGNTMDILPTLGDYDMIICSDMLEHLNEKDGLFLLNLIKEKSKFAMIVTPVKVLRQKALYNNEHEKHISVWPKETLSKWGQVFQFDNAYLLEISATAQAKYGDTVRVHYMGRLQDGTVFASTINGAPLQLTIGKSQVIPGFEHAVVGMGVGESKTTEITADSAYGPYRKEMTQTIERDQFPKHLKPEVGQQLQDHQADGRIIKVMVTNVSESSVTLDANHPLVGKDLTFDIQLVEVI
ncbi:MAG: FKBP-type peptidyl-prolyl cis-trans isomerase [Planctomycetota bacterium]